MAVIQHPVNTSNATPGTTASCTWTSATSASNLLLAIIIVAASGVNLPSISTPTGFSACIPTFGGNGGGNADPRMAMFQIPNAGSQSGTVNSTLGASKNWIMYLLEISGIATSTPLDQSQINPGQANITSGDTGTTAALAGSNDFAVGVLATRNNPVFSSPTNGFAIDRQDTSGTVTLNGELGACILTKTLSSNAGVIAGASYSPTNQATGMIAAFKANITTRIPRYGFINHSNPGVV